MGFAARPTHPYGVSIASPGFAELRHLDGEIEAWTTAYLLRASLIESARKRPERSARREGSRHDPRTTSSPVTKFLWTARYGP
jgi:hypothetical protein